MDDAPRGLPGQPIELAGGTHVFIDDHLIERTSALTRTAHRARRLPRPVLESGPGTRHTQVLFFPRVFHDPGNRAAPFRMWYDAGFTGSERRSYGYAESDDGLTWRFPELGIVEIAGSRANNVVRRGAYCMCLVDHARYGSGACRRPGAALRAALHRRRPLLRRVLARRIPLDRRPGQTPCTWTPSTAWRTG